MTHRLFLYPILMTFIVFSTIISFLPVFPSLKAYVDQQERPLAGMVIVIDPGHGGWDNGAERNNVVEDEINFLIAEELFAFLINAGSIVFFTRAGDYDLASLYASNRKREDMNRRVRFIRSVSPSLVISIHLNVFQDSSVFGGQVFYQEQDSSSKELSSTLQDYLNRLSGKNKLSKPGHYFILEEVHTLGVLVECGFLSNPAERSRLLSSRYQQQIAKALFDGIMVYFS